MRSRESQLKTLDITSDTCPITYVRTKLALEAMSEGDVLEVTMRVGEPARNVPRSLREDGHEIEAEGECGGGLFRVVVRKGRDDGGRG